MDRSAVSSTGRSSAETARSSDNSSAGDGRPRVVLYAADGTGADSIDNDDAHSELDLDLYDTDDVADSWDQQFSIGGTTIGGSILSEPTSAAEAYSYSQQALVQQRQHNPLRSRHVDEATASEVSSQDRRRMLTFDTASSTSSQNYRIGRVPLDYQPYIRTNFTTTQDVGTPTDPYEMLGTPPGDPPSTRPDEMPTLEPEVRLPRAMKPWWLFAVILASFAAGAAGLAFDPPSEVGYWFNEVGMLYIRAVNCITLPMAFCQVVVSVSTLTTKSTLAKLWLKTLGLFAAICTASVLAAVTVAYSIRPLMKQQGDLGLSLSHAKFAFKCPNGKYIQQELDGELTCRGDAVQANTTFPWVVDRDGALGLDESVSTVDITGYFAMLFSMYFPSNLVDSFAKDKFLSALIIGSVVGVAVTRSFRGLESRSNPLLRLAMHIYSSLFSMLEWLQQAAFLAASAVLTGSVLVSPDTGHTMSMARYYCLSIVLVALVHCVVIVPAALYVFTKRNPFTWLLRVATPILYALILQSPFLPLSVATKAVMRTKEVPPAVFGAIYPPLAALNRLAQAMGLPLVLVFVAAFSGCEIELSALEALKLFGVTYLACWGDAALGRPQLAYVLTIWRTMCTNEDTPSAVIAVSTLSLFTYRLAAVVNALTNLAIVRMVAATKQSKMHA